MLAVFLIVLLGLIAISVPVAFSLILTALVLAMLMGGAQPAELAQNLIRGVDNYPLMAVPFFLLAGEIMNAGGLSKRIVEFARSILGHVTGGLGYVTVLASMLFAGVSGSAVADTSAIGSIVYPVMKAEGYDPKKSTALFTAAGTIGPIIPPSIPLILYGVIGNVSIVALFLAGIVPGVMIGVALMVGWYFHARRMHYKKSGSFSFKGVGKATVKAFWALLLPLIILGGIVGGIYTATEAAVIAVVYAFVISVFVYKELKLSMIPQILLRASKSTAVVLMVCGTATAAAFNITTAQIPQMLSNTLVSLAGNNWMLTMMWMNLLLLLVGCVMDLAPAILILAPMLIPIVVNVGLSPVYFGAIMTVNLCIGLITPPVGNVLFTGCIVSKQSVGDIVRAIMPNVFIMTATLFFITYLPGVVMFIPNLFK
ncbi:MAG TPA: TRAP transporter large permease [Spirochaetia bacterium]|nr:TRAP transporter large permease [Spirochaetia bacterium]